MKRYVVAAASEVQPGTRRIVEVAGRSIGIFNVEGRLYALRNVCPHHGAALCLGGVGGRMLPAKPQQYDFAEDGTIVRCPWHGYQFRLEDGRSPIRPDTFRVRAYRVEVEDDDVVLYA